MGKNQDMKTLSFNTYALYAYDFSWLLARVLDVLLSEGENISFSYDHKLKDMNGSSLQSSILRRFDQGEKLLQILSTKNFTEGSGQVKIDLEREFIHPAFKVLNIFGTCSHRICYYSNHSGFSAATSAMKHTNKSVNDKQVYDVMWRGETIKVRREWVFPNNGKPLQISVPSRVTYREFIIKDNGPIGAKGYYIHVSEAAVDLLPSHVHHTYQLYGIGQRNLSFSDLVCDVSQYNFDATMGDVTIVTNRTSMVDVTHPFLESGLVVVVYVEKVKSSAWVFLKPFNWERWCVTGALIVTQQFSSFHLEDKVSLWARGNVMTSHGPRDWARPNDLNNFSLHKNKCSNDNSRPEVNENSQGVENGNVKKGNTKEA